MAQIKRTAPTTRGLIAAVALIAGTSAALAQGTEAQREACTPDAFRLCGQFIPDAGRIEGCLRDAGPRLSPGCYAVFYPQAVQNPQSQARPRLVRRQWSSEDDE